MSDHVIRWEHDHDHVTASVVCNAKHDADCRLHCPEGCEEWGRIVRRDDGPWHTIPGSVNPLHKVVARDCNVCDFINDDPYLIPELATDDTPTFVIAETPIEPEWDGDNYLWKRKS